MLYVISVKRIGEQRSIELGIERNKREMALKMLRCNPPIDQITEFTDRSLEQI